MATTISPATMTVTIKAEIKLAGQDKGFSHSYTIPSVTEVVNRIMEVPTAEMAVLVFTATNPGSATAIGLNEADVRFICHRTRRSAPWPKRRARQPLPHC